MIGLEVDRIGKFLCRGTAANIGAEAACSVRSDRLTLNSYPPADPAAPRSEAVEKAQTAYESALTEYLLTVPGREEYSNEIRRKKMVYEDVDSLLRRLNSLREVAKQRQLLGSIATEDWTVEEMDEWEVPLQALIETIQRSPHPKREVRQLRYFLRKERDRCAQSMVERVNTGEQPQDQGELMHAYRRTEYLYLKFDEWEEANVGGGG